MQLAQANCFYVSSSTIVCLEGDSIRDLYHGDNIKDLYAVRA